MLAKKARNVYYTHPPSPARLSDAEKLALQGQVAKAIAGEIKLGNNRASPATLGAAAIHARLGRDGRQLSESKLCKHARLGGHVCTARDKAQRPSQRLIVGNGYSPQAVRVRLAAHIARGGRMSALVIGRNTFPQRQSHPC